METVTFTFTYRNYLKLFKKIHISSAIFRLPGSTRYPGTLDEKVEELIELLAEKEIDDPKKTELQQRLNEAIHTSGSGKTGKRERWAAENSGAWLENEMDIILTRRKTKHLTYRRTRGIGHLSSAFRIIISVLLVTLGLAMIILPTPASFEIYTIYYFNANDGFTVMDLISLIIVFCGIYTLITTKRDRGLH